MTNYISVIIPVYNSDRHIEKCIKSILQGDYKQFEIILINDGSTDTSGSICDIFAVEYANIRVIHQKNNGASYARNVGIDQAKGEYIAFIDSDDYVSPNYLSELLRAILRDNSDLSVCNIIAVCDGNESNAFLLNNQTININKLQSSQEKSDFFYLFEKNLLFGPCNKLYSHSILSNKKIRFPIDVLYGEDLLFNLDYLSLCNRISCCANAQYYYQSNPFSVSHSYRHDRFNNGLRLNMALFSFFETRELLSSDVSKYIYARIFDDAYNAVFEICSTDFKGSFRQRRMEIMNIMCNKCVQEALQVINTIIYPQLYVFMFKKKTYSLFSLFFTAKNHIINSIRERSHHVR